MKKMLQRMTAALRRPYWLCVLLVATAAAPAPAADPDLTGTWQGKLQAAPGTSINIQFVFARKPDGTLTVTLNSPDNGAIKNIAADGVSYTAGTLKLQVPSLSGSYTGTVKGNTIEGQWSQPGGTLPLVLAPYQKPTIAKADMDLLTSGAWTGPVKPPGATFTFVVKFKQEKGELQGTLLILEVGQELPLSDIEFSGGKLLCKLPQAGGAELSATYANGALTGTWTARGQPLPIELKKGEAPVLALKLTAEQFAQLAGSWGGTVEFANPTGQKISLPTVMRFEKDAKGHFLGYLDSPAQKAMGIAITEATLTGSKLVAKIAGIGGEFNADVSADALSGQMTQRGQTVPLTLKKGFVPSLALKLTPEAFSKLAGAWDGTVVATNPQGQKISIPVVFRIEKDAKGEIFAYLDSPSQNVTGIPVTEATLTANKVVLKAVANAAEYDGELAGKTLTGNWKQGPIDVPVTFTHR
jgi:hypothetical protein